MAPGVQAVMALALVYVFSVQVPDYEWFALFVLVFLTGLLRSDRAGLAPYFIAGALAGFYVLIKLSLGVGALMTLALGCVLVRQPGLAARRLGGTVVAATAGFLIPWAASGGTLAGIGSYLTTGWEVSRGYSSAMSRFENDLWWVEVASFLVWFALIPVWVVIQPSPRNRLALMGLLVPLFVAWKHSVVR